MARKKKIKKPTGTIGPWVAESSKITHHKVQFPDQKDKIEMLIMEGFCRSLDKTFFLPGMSVSITPISILSFTQNHENDFDFYVETNQGPRDLELMEAVHFEANRGVYTSENDGVVKLSGYDQAKHLTTEVVKKSEKYGAGGKENRILLIYATDKRYSPLNPTFVVLLECFIASKSPNFEYIFYYSPGNTNNNPPAGFVFLIYPTKRTLSIDPEAYKNNQSIIPNTNALKMDTEGSFYFNI